MINSQVQIGSTGVQQKSGDLQSGIQIEKNYIAFHKGKSFSVDNRSGPSCSNSFGVLEEIGGSKEGLVQIEKELNDVGRKGRKMLAYHKC